MENLQTQIISLIKERKMMPEILQSIYDLLTTQSEQECIHEVLVDHHHWHDNGYTHSFHSQEEDDEIICIGGNPFHHSPPPNRHRGRDMERTDALAEEVVVASNSLWAEEAFITANRTVVDSLDNAVRPLDNPPTLERARVDLSEEEGRDLERAGLSLSGEEVLAAIALRNTLGPNAIERIRNQILGDVR